MSVDALASLARHRQAGSPAGITSVCSAHPLVIEAALLQAAEDGSTALIEATCNQVNQEGGYTGMTPSDFRALVEGIADRVGLPRARILLGGDHLGPNPWRHRPAGEAMARAADMIAAYAAAGFEKLHLDCSMGCAGEPAALDDRTTAGRAASLAARAEAAAASRPVYVIGTEVPTPGGALEALDHLRPTAPEAVRRTHGIHAEAFRDLPDAWARVVGIVVQPGVEFGPASVAVYAPEPARALAEALGDLPGLVYEAHSTDYQPETALANMVRDGFAILKVGPALTFALREALYGLDAIAGFLSPERPSLRDAMERLMVASPAHWAAHTPGTAAEQRVLRHYGYGDRIRYYWPAPDAAEAVEALLGSFGDAPIGETLVSQHLPRAVERVRSGVVRATARNLLIEAVRDVLRSYARAAGTRDETARRTP